MTATASLFTTKRTNVKDRTSRTVKVLAIHFDHATQSMRVFCNDGYTRECRIDRLTDREHGRRMWVHLKECINKGYDIMFVAAGGFSPDKWFYDMVTITETDSNIPF